ncbi:MAG: histidine kinase dimerization/phospho-acceptor domain-containing protein, partial [Anaerolineae bacterium]|nr:histidine kinase dimerization/phospho-acceptor domain-containing protein [Anaerolineae bacterium]
MSNFLGGPAVTLAYYLFTLFGIEAALATAWSQWRRSDSFRARRLATAFLGLTVLRLMLILLVLVGRSAAEIGNLWLPPFERVLGVASLGFLIWAFTPTFRQKNFLGTTLLAVNTSFAFIFYALAVYFWQGDNFNLTTWDIWFVLWQAVLVLFGAVSCATKLDDERTYALFGFVALLIGYVAHFLLASEYVQPHVPVWIRMAELVAYPIFAVAVYQGAIQSLSARSQELQSLSDASSGEVKRLIALSKATRQINASLDLETVTNGAAESVAQAISANIAAIALPEDEAFSQLRLVSIYNPNRQGRGEAVTFPLSDQQVIKHAVNRRYQVQIDEYQDNSQIRFLFALMGANDVGPLLVQPLLHENEPIGVLIAGNPISKRVFTKGEEHLCRTLGDQIAIAISQARAYAETTARSQQLSWTLRNQELESGKRLAAMETELKKSREEVNLFAQRMHQFESSSEADKATLKQAEERIAKLDKALEVARVEVEKGRRLDKKFLTLSDEAENFKQQIADLANEKQALLARIEALEAETAEIDQLKETLEKSNQRSRKLARALKRARSVSQQAAPVPSTLSGAEAGSQLEDLSCGVIISNGKGRIEQANAAASRMLATPNKRLVGSELINIVEDKRWAEAFERASSSNELMLTTTVNVGETILRATISPMAVEESNGSDGDKEIEGTVTILYDITAEAESQQARDEFVASLSQELRTPMTSITGYTDLLLGESVGLIGEMQRKFLQRIKANIERMGSMLSDLIGVTAIDAGQLEIRPVVVDMAEVIEDALISARARLEENEIALDVNLLEDMPLVEVDPESVRQILSNLINNAIKSTPAGKTIGVSTSTYEVEENGSGDKSA